MVRIEKRPTPIATQMAIGVEPGMSAFKPIGKACEDSGIGTSSEYGEFRLQSLELTELRDIHAGAPSTLHCNRLQLKLNLTVAPKVAGMAA